MENASNGESQKAYWAKDIAELLDTSTSNLRRWSLDLEGSGYRFYRDEHNRRAYMEKDIMPLKKLKEFLSNGMSKNDAVNAVVSMFPQDEIGVNTIPVNNDNISLSKRELGEIVHIAVKEAIEEEREAMFQAFENKMNDVVEKRDRYLTQQMKQSLEEQKRAIAETAATVAPEKKSFFQRLFK